MGGVAWLCVTSGFGGECSWVRGDFVVELNLGWVAWVGVT